MGTAGMILAGSEDATVKMIVGALVLIGWVVTQVVGAANKLREKRKPPLARPTPTANAPAPRRQGTRPAPVSFRKTENPAVTARRPVPVPPQRPVPAPVARPPMIKSSIETSPLVLRSTTLGSPGEMLRPQNLKAAFVLTELLRPPLALRTPEDDQAAL